MTIEHDIQVSKARVLDEVHKKTEYIGQKATSEQDPGAYERIAATLANREQLDIFWMEACTSANVLLDHWMTSATSQELTHHPEIGTAHDYNVELSLPGNWANAYLPAVKEALMSYLVNSIVTKWLLMTQPTQAAAYAALADGTGKQLQQMMLMRKRPTRRTSSGAGHSDVWGNSATLWGESGLWGSSQLWGGEQLWES